MRLPNEIVMNRIEAVIPQDFLYDLASTIRRAWSQSREDSALGVSSQGLRHQVRPYWRNALLGDGLIKIANKHFKIENFSDFEIQSIIANNIAGTYKFVELIISNEIILTLSVTPYSNSLPRKSRSRKELAQNNPCVFQPSLWENNIDKDTSMHYNNSVGNKVYGIITCGPSQAKFPEFAKILVPDYNYKCTLGSVDLLRCSKPYQEEVDLSVQEVEKPSAKLRLKKIENIEEDGIKQEGGET